MYKVFEKDLFRSRCELNDSDSCLSVMRSLWPLSPWIMKPEYLASACSCPSVPAGIKKLLQMSESQRMSRDRGSCHVLFVFKDQDILGYAPHLRTSFALPLIWKENTEHSSCLPSKLRSLADAILEEVHPQSPWGLHFHFRTESNQDLSKLDMEYESGWASLAAALLLAEKGGIPDPTVWASAAWDREKGIQPVDGLESKILCIYELGGRILFVPSQNKEQAEEISKKIAAKNNYRPLEIQDFTAGNNSEIKVLYPYLSKLDYPPDKDRDLQERCQYYRRQIEIDQEQANKYYVQNLQEDLAEECGKKGILDMEGIAPQDIKNLVSFVSLQPSAMFVLAAIKPKNLLIFYTQESENEVPKMEQQIYAYGGSVEKKRINVGQTNPENDRQIHETIQDFITRHLPEKTALDVTPGPKDFTLIASWAVDGKENPLLYLCHYYNSQTKRYDPGKECIRRLRPQAWKQ